MVTALLSPFEIGAVGDLFRSVVVETGMLLDDKEGGDEDFSSGEVVFGMLTLILALPG